MILGKRWFQLAESYISRSLLHLPPRGWAHGAALTMCQSRGVFAGTHPKDSLHVFPGGRARSTVLGAWTREARSTRAVQSQEGVPYRLV